MSSMSRRHLMFAATGIAAVAATPRLVFAQAAAPAPAPAAAAPAGPFTLPPLTYPTNAFEPHIDAKTMEIHHDRHHAAYVANLNNVAKTNPQLGTAKIEDVLGNLNALDDSIKFTVRNNLGGHANHTMFWEIMGPNGGGEPSGALADAIGSTFDSLDDLKKLVNDAGVRRFGSGWTWLVWDGTGLAVKSTPNQDSPIMDSDVPLLGIDVWEHAYYLRYQNRRPDYLEAWWNVVDWDAVGARFEAASS